MSFSFLDIESLKRALAARIRTLTGDRVIEVRRNGDVATLGLNIEALIPLIPRGSGEGVIATQYRFKSHSTNGDCIICRTWDGTTEGGTDVFVAKPFLLRKTPFHGLTYDSVSYTYVTAIERTATAGATTETQRVTMNYVLNDLIWAISVVDTLADDDSSNNVTILDLNVDARAWAKV